MNFDSIAAHGADALIVFKSNITGKSGGMFGKAFHFVSLHRKEFLQSNYKRSSVESAFSMIKRKFDNSVRSKANTAMTNEALCIIIYHNICCLITAKHELGIEPKLLAVWLSLDAIHHVVLYKSTWWYSVVIVGYSRNSCFFGDQMFKDDHYVPILKGKSGEFDGIAMLTSVVKDRFTPLIEVPPVDWDYKNDAPKMTIDDHIGKIPGKIVGCWESHRNFFVDAAEIVDHTVTATGFHPLVDIFNALRAANMNGIPVTSIGRSTSYQNAVASIVAADQRGVCLRISSSDLSSLPALQASIDLLLTSLGIGHHEADIIVDFGEVADTQLPTVQLAVNAILPQFPDIMTWRTFTLAATGMPADMTHHSANTVERDTRTEWLLWSKLIAQSPTIQRRPTFADYGTSHPGYPQLDFRKIKMGAKIKYTSDVAWVIVKGVSFERGGYVQYRNLARVLIAQPEYCGPLFSWGDKYIYDCANNAAGPGGLQKWVSVGTNHHITFVTNQVASFGVTLGTP